MNKETEIAASIATPMECRKCGVSCYCHVTGMYSSSPDAVDRTALNEAGEFLLLAAESAKKDGGREFAGTTRQALLRWRMGAEMFRASFLEDDVFMRRINAALKR